MKIRPKILTGNTYQIKTGCGNLYVTVNLDKEVPFEVFIGMGQAGGCYRVVTEAIARLVSMHLRNGALPKDIAKQLMGLSCDHPMSFPKDKSNMSCIDAVAKVLVQFDSMDPLGSDKDRPSPWIENLNLPDPYEDA